MVVVVKKQIKAERTKSTIKKFSMAGKNIFRCIICLALNIMNLAGFSQIFEGPACDNEEFESSPAGIITSSTAINGWIAKQLTNPSFICNYSVLPTPSLILESNPDPNYVELYNAPNGIVDLNIGPTYSIYSVFGGTLVNQGPSQNPAIPQMFGTKFIRINKDGAVNRNHSLEKTFLVTASNSLFRFAYLPVIQPKAGANCCEQPGIYINFFNASANNTLLPCPSYSITGSTSQCINQTIPAPGLSVCPNNSLAYYSKWKIIAVDLSNYIGSNITFKLGAMDCASGCTHFAYAYVDAQCGPMEMLINGNPVPATNTISYSLCGINSASITAPANFLSYNWVGPSAFISTQSSIVVSTFGTYTLTMGTGGGCSSITKYVTINSFPSATISAASNPTVICTGGSATLTASGVSSYSLNSNTSNSMVVVSPTTSTTYTFSGTDLNNCFASTSVSVNVVSCVGLRSTIKENAHINIYPNPSNGELFVLIEQAVADSKIEIINILGQIVFSQEINESKKEYKISNLQAGVYTMRYLSNNTTQDTKKLIVR
jgi:hypothetical protein